MRRSLAVVLAALGAFGVAISACAAPRRSEPIVGPPALDAKEQQGQVAFMRVCNACHPGGEGGLGGSLTKPMPEVYIKTKVRSGIGGDMPKFGDDVLSDGELDAVVAYIEKMRNNE